MRTLVLLLSVVVLGGCGQTSDGQTLYPNNDLVLVVGNAARMTCSCLFVMGRDETYCRAWTKANPDIARFSVDLKEKTVEASSLVAWSAKAHFVNEKVGCVLE